MNGATVAITGGTGSFGSTMVGHLLTRGVDSVHILSRDETKQDDMRRRFSDQRLKFFLGDVRDYDSVAAAFVNVDFVFHAAALKQVPSCEFFPQQAVKTNVVGSTQCRRGGRSRRCAVAGMPQHRQGRLPGQRDGYVESSDGEDRPGLRPQPPDVADNGVGDAIRQRHVFSRLGHPHVRRAGSGGASDDSDRADV